MRKMGELAAVLFAAFLIAVSIPMVTFAAGGWQKECVGEEEEIWVYQDEDGNRITDALIEYEDHMYYLDGNGFMVTNRWVLYPHDSGTPEYGNRIEVETGEEGPFWYYFNSVGKACRGVRKSIDGNIYVFDEDGRMIADRLLHLDDDIYYVNKDGALAVNQWVSFLNGPGNEEPCEEPVTTVWYYFGPTGKACVGKKKTIGENSYIFDDEGHMLSGWQTYGDESDLYYLGAQDQGFIHTGWVYTYAPADSEASGEEGWYYLDGKGIPFNYQAKDTSMKKEYGWDICQEIDDRDLEDQHTGAAARVIEKKTYLFDEEGRMLTGVYYLQGIKRKGGSMMGHIPIGSDLFTGAFYYFNEEEGASYGQMMTGRQTVEGGTDTNYYYFQDNGQAYKNFIVDGFLYDEYGLRVESDDDGYMLWEIPRDRVIKEKGSGKKYKDSTFVVSPSGKLKKSGTVKFDGFKYTVKHYEVVKEEEDN